jgi:CBS domain-containing membrane protein
MSGTSSPPSNPPPAEQPASEIVEIEPGPGEPPPVPKAKSGAPPAPDKRPSDAPAPLSVADLPPRAWPPQTVGDLMTRKVITVQENEPLGDLEGWMTRFRFRHLPVVGAGVKLVGLITRVDYLHALLGTLPDGKATPRADDSTPAYVVMNKNVVTARIDSPIVTALQVMLHEKLGCLPVVRDDNTLVGIVTETDFARLALELLQKQGE